MVIMVYLLFVLGLYLLIKSAGWVVGGSSSLAKKFGVSSLMIGLTIVGFGTSLPELVVNLFAATSGTSDIVFGNIIGSNIANVLLVLGVTAIITNIKLKSSTVWREIPFALLASFVLFILTSRIFFHMEGNFLVWTDALILLGMFGAFLYYVFRMARVDKKNVSLVGEVDDSGLEIFGKILLGLIGIYFGARWTVDGAIAIANVLGITGYLVSATIVALGTSLPELSVCITAAIKKNIDLAVGNVIGSNIFNILWVLGIVPLFAPLAIPTFIAFDVAIMFFSTLLLFVLMFIGKRHGMTKKNGILFVILYILYILYIVIRG